MREIKILTDTGADLFDLLEQNKVEIIPLYITFDGENYLKQYKDIKTSEFYEKLKAATDFHPKTSLASPQDYIDTFTPHLDKGCDIFYICMDSKFSGSFQAAMGAKNLLLDEYKDAQIEVIDSGTVTVMQALLAIKAMKLKNEGKNIDEIKNTIEKMIGDEFAYFTVETLHYLKEGGRIGKAAAFLGEFLNIKPLLLLKDKEIFPVDKVRGRKKSIQAVIDYTKKNFPEDSDDYYLSIVHSIPEDDFKELKAYAESELGRPFDFESLLGISVGLHAGPGTIGICLSRK